MHAYTTCACVLALASLHSPLTSRSPPLPFSRASLSLTSRSALSVLLTLESLTHMHSAVEVEELLLVDFPAGLPYLDAYADVC
jgi:hypothetical protein